MAIRFTPPELLLILQVTVNAAAVRETMEEIALGVLNSKLSLCE